MSDTQFQFLLELTIRRLEADRRMGRRFATLSKEDLRALEKPKKPKPAPESPKQTKRAPQPQESQAISNVVETQFDSEHSAPSEIANLSFNDLRAKALACEKCPNLAQARRAVVFGVGDESADLMFIGEAPGVEEDAQGEPFVGKAGQLLTRIIQTMGLSRDTVYIANILKCRPDTPNQRFGNRPPTTEEMETCKPYLIEQIRHIRPKVIVALGATAITGLLGKQSRGITSTRGVWREFQGIPLMPTFHPSYLLRRDENAEKRKVWEDMLQVMERLGMPISEKQRRYFSK